jgi:hypothetical protein
MADKELRKLLEQLHTEIERTKKVDDKGQALLRDLDGHIRELLRRSEAASLQPMPALLNRLDEAVKHFERTHPTLTMALSEVVSELSKAGL